MARELRRDRARPRQPETRCAAAGSPSPRRARAPAPTRLLTPRSRAPGARRRSGSHGGISRRGSIGQRASRAPRTARRVLPAHSENCGAKRGSTPGTVPGSCTSGQLVEAGSPGRMAATASANGCSRSRPPRPPGRSGGDPRDPLRRHRAVVACDDRGDPVRPAAPPADSRPLVDPARLRAQQARRPAMQRRGRSRRNIERRA